VEIDKDNKEYRAGAFFGVVATVLVLALTAMAFTALDPLARSAHEIAWDVSAPEPVPVIVPSFGS
jgi:hypothetical protein